MVPNKTEVVVPNKTGVVAPKPDPKLLIPEVGKEVSNILDWDGGFSKVDRT